MATVDWLVGPAGFAIAGTSALGVATISMGRPSLAGATRIVNECRRDRCKFTVAICSNRRQERSLAQ